MKTKTNKCLVFCVVFFICLTTELCLTFSSSEGYDQSDLYVQLIPRLDDQTVIAKGPYNTYSLQYQLTPVGNGYYTKNVISGVSYTLSVNGQIATNLYINGYGPFSRVYIPVNGYADVTVLLDTNLLLDSISPKGALLGQDLDVTLTGIGLDENNTQVSMYLTPDNIIEIDSPITKIDDLNISLTLPGQTIPGKYTIIVSDGSETSELPNAITFSLPKAIIVAGGGPYSRNALWNATKTCTNYAYKVLRHQGFSEDRIYYLNAETETDADGDGISDADAETTYDNLHYAISNWVMDPDNPAHELLIYMANHGGEGTFLLNEEEVVTAKTLDTWLDELQTEMSGKVVLIYDACYAGSFIPLLTTPYGKERVIITSSGANENAWFLSDGRNSFSWHLWASVFFDGNLYDAFVYSKEIVAVNQMSFIDADGNGRGNEKMDYNLAGDLIIGEGLVAASALAPRINLADNQIILYGESSATIQVKVLSLLNDIKRVWGVVMEPDYNFETSGSPVTDLPTIEFQYMGQNEKNREEFYEGFYEDFTKYGSYKINLYAEDTQGLCSLPESVIVVQTEGSGEPKADEWLEINGSVKYDDGNESTPVCAMILANGQYMFSCDESEGKYKLRVPRDENNEITLFAFCEGLAPFKQVLKSYEAPYVDIIISPASENSPNMVVTHKIDTPVIHPDWVRITGMVSDETGSPLCAMILANGQHMFTCAGDGRYDLEVPLDENGKITLFGFCEGMLPFKAIIP